MQTTIRLNTRPVVVPVHLSSGALVGFIAYRHFWLQDKVEILRDHARNKKIWNHHGICWLQWHYSGELTVPFPPFDLKYSCSRTAAQTTFFKGFVKQLLSKWIQMNAIFKQDGFDRLHHPFMFPRCRRFVFSKLTVDFQNFLVVVFDRNSPGSLSKEQLTNINLGDSESGFKYTHKTEDLRTNIWRGFVGVCVVAADVDDDDIRSCFHQQTF